MYDDSGVTKANHFSIPKTNLLHNQRSGKVEREWIEWHNTDDKYQVFTSKDNIAHYPAHYNLVDHDCMTLLQILMIKCNSVYQELQNLASYFQTKFTNI